MWNGVILRGQIADAEEAGGLATPGMRARCVIIMMDPLSYKIIKNIGCNPEKLQGALMLT